MPIYVEREEPLNQGDIFAEVDFTLPRGASRVPETRAGMVLSHSCDCDKYFAELERDRVPEPDCWPVTVAPIHEISELDAGKAGDARRNRIKRFFYLPAEGGFDEMVVDLWFEQPIPIVQLDPDGRLTSLSDDWVKRLHIQMWELRTRIKAEDAFKEPS